MVVDTSAWVEFLRGTDSPVEKALSRAIRADEELGVPDVVRLELLAGARSAEAAGQLARLLARFVALPAASPADHEHAAWLYREVRSRGETVRSLIDCLVAAAALRLDVPLLARDRDYTLISAVSPLRLSTPTR